MTTIEELEQLLIQAKLQIAQKSGEVDVINFIPRQLYQPTSQLTHRIKIMSFSHKQLLLMFNKS